jgi:hypothetical protein
MAAALGARVVAGGSALLELRHTAEARAVSGATVERLLELRFRRADGHEVIASDWPLMMAPDDGTISFVSCSSAR